MIKFHQKFDFFIEFNQNVTAGDDQILELNQKIMKSQIKISLQCLDREINFDQ